MPKCSVCGINDVLSEGGVCEMCAVSQDPYVKIMQRQHGPRAGGPLVQPQTKPDDTPRTNHSRAILVGHNTANTPSVPAAVVSPQDAVPVSKPGQAVVTKPGTSTVTKTASTTAAPAKNAWACEGIIKNVQAGTRQRNMVEQVFDALFNATPMTKVPDVLSFQVYPDFSGSNTTASGSVCDQVLVYGQINVGSISENNHVRVYGNRDRQNNIVATRIENTASSTVIQPGKTISPVSVCVMILALAVLLFLVAMSAETLLPAIGNILLLIVGILALPAIVRFLFGIFRH